jgi:hypothetical protein
VGEPFTETPDLGVFTSARVMERGEPICLVFHDEDGDWQFLSGYEERAHEVRLVHVEHIIGWDDTVVAIADLPRGWKAWRESPEHQWMRQPIPHDQAHVEE